MVAASYWAQRIARADRKGAKNGMEARMDRLRGQLTRADSTVADRMCREVAAAIEATLKRHGQ